MRLKWVAMVCVVSALFGCSQYEKFVARSQQGECHSYLRMLAEDERAYFEKHGEFTESADALGAHVQRFYAYVLGNTVLLPPESKTPKEALVGRIPESIRQTLHVRKDSFTIACVADLDGDPTIDLWTISSEPRTFNGRVLPAYGFRIESDDVSEQGPY